ncbi:MAG: nucleoside:proton symporter [Rhodobiaceae bacterium]|nr:MAG: nucleoside:proton symporter [Rhodobiaceae bacterium]
MYAAQSGFGLLVLTLLAWGLSEDRSRLSWRLVVTGLGLQIAIALVLTKVPVARDVLVSLNGLVDALMAATNKGTSFVFGYMGGGSAPFDITYPQHFFVLGFQALPLVLVVSALSALLWYWRILPWVTKGFAMALQRAFNLGGAVGFGTAANVFLGMVEAPLLIRPYISRLTRSELFVLMTVGLATVAGTVIVLYAFVLSSILDGAMGQIITASLISLPAAVLVAKLMVPGSANEVPTSGDVTSADLGYQSSMDAVTRGTLDGLSLFLNILAMLLVLVALVALANILLGLLPDVFDAPLTMQRLFGWAFAPLVWLMGIPWGEASTAGQLMGTKTVLNEFIAYLDLTNTPESALSPRSRLIMIYGLCGFANFGSVGIMIGGLSAIAPDRREEITSLAMKALVGGTLAAAMTGAVIGMIS